MSLSMVTSSWFRFLFPVVLLVIIALGIDNVVMLVHANQSVTLHFPYILFGVCILLGHIFKQSRCSMISCAMFIAYWIIQHYLQTPLSTGTTILDLSLLAFALPGACLAIYMFKDSTIRSASFLGYMAILLLMLVWSQLTLNYAIETNFDQYQYPILHVVPEVSKLPFVLVLYLAGIVLLCAIIVLKYNRIVDAAVYSSVLVAAATFIFFHVSYVSSVLFSLAGILLLVSLLSASYELAFNDRLTLIPGRLALESDLKHLGRKYSLAMLDIDHFKSFNDTYGHDTGDDVLKLVASKLREVGGNARVYRYGGEEFTVLFKGKYADEAWDYLEELRQNIESYDLIVRNMDSRPSDNKEGSKKRGKGKKSNTVNLTISIGVADSYEERDTDVVLKAADQALYKAKQNGRNQVVAAA
ncbi:GGDEF domain-containing protein [Vibrio taketomensis]|uniref:GGDEF domain-containing protein n=1 Tax=Vibrio taketomensis TaxID=2572923 RepID=UPI001389E53F|nr:GGDEF domain-containing protein [Vibrio taketomensis]